MATRKHSTIKAQMTRASLIVAAAAILRAEGPGAVTYRRVAQDAGASSSSVGYHFESIDELLREAAEFNVRLWAQRAEKAAAEAESMDPAQAHEHSVDLLLKACLPEEIVVPVAHYRQLMTASESQVVTETYRRGRGRLDAALSRILRVLDIDLDPQIIVAIVDGAAVGGISQGYPVREMAQALLTNVLNYVKEAGARGVYASEIRGQNRISLTDDLKVLSEKNDAAEDTDAAADEDA